MKKVVLRRNFMLYADKTAKTSPHNSGQILLYPFKSLSVQPFSFPFSGMQRVRDALKIQFRPLLGERAEDISLIPLITKSEKKSSEGAVFLLKEANLGEKNGSENDQAQDIVLWPLPLVFAAEVNGSGLIIWEDEEQIISLWLRNWVPMLYRWSSREQTTIDEERAMVSAYAQERGLTLESVFAMEGASCGMADVQKYGDRTLRAYNAYEHLDLSNRGANLLERRERIIGLLMKWTRFAIASGLAFSVITGALFWQRLDTQAVTANFSENIYASAFGERSRQPLASIREKMSALGKDKQDTSLQGILRTLGPVWGELAQSEDIAIEMMKFSNEKTDLLGTAKDNSAIQHLRVLLEGRGFSLKTDNTQLIPGGGLRFSLSISRGSKS